MSKRAQIRRLVNATAEDLSALGVSDRRKMILTLREAEVELAKELGAWYAAVDPASNYTIRKNIALHRHIKGTLARLKDTKGQVKETLTSVRGKGALMALQHLQRNTPHLQAIAGAPYRSLNLDIVKIINSGDHLLIRKHNALSRRYSAGAVNHVQRSLALGILRQESVGGMVARLASGSVLPRDNNIIARAANGVMRRPVSDLNRIVRTEVINTYNTYHTEGIKEAGLKKQWDATYDRTCVICRGLHGEVVGANEEFSDGSYHPPAHPYCRCTVVGWDPEWDMDN